MRSRVFYMVPALWCLAAPSLAAGSQASGPQASGPQVAEAANRVALVAEHLFPGGGDTGFTQAVAARRVGVTPQEHKPRPAPLPRRV